MDRNWCGVKHEQSAKHLNDVIGLSFLGKVNIAVQADTAYKLSVAKHTIAAVGQICVL